MAVCKGCKSHTLLYGKDCFPLAPVATTTGGKEHDECLSGRNTALLEQVPESPSIYSSSVF